MTFTPVPYGTFSPQAALSQGTTATRLGKSVSVGSTTAGTTLAARELWITADSGNSGSVYIGDATVTSSGGGNVHTKLTAGGICVMQVRDASLVCIVGSASSQTVYWSVLDA